MMKKLFHFLSTYLEDIISIKDREQKADDKLLEHHIDEPDIDAIDVRQTINDYAFHARKMGRYTAFSIIGASWTLSYQYFQFRPDQLVKYALVCAVIYLLLEYCYFVFINMMYKYILNNYFDPNKNGFKKREGKSVNMITKKVSFWGSIQMIINSLLLFTSIILLINHILNISCS